MLARRLVNLPFKRLSEPEVIGMEGQYLLTPNGVIRTPSQHVPALITAPIAKVC